MRKPRKSITVFILLIACIPIILFAVVAWYNKNPGKLPMYGEVNQAASNFRMTDQHGKEATKEMWNNKIVVVDFFFTHCPSICPKMTKNLKTVQQAFSNDPQLLIQSFSVDPERDSVGRLAMYANQFQIGGDNWNLITGDKKQIYSLARKGFQLIATKGDGGPEDFIHSEKLVLIDMKKRIRGYYDGTSTAATKQLIKDIDKIKKENGG